MLLSCKDGREITKKRDASAKVCFANLNLLLLCCSHCGRRRRRCVGRTTIDGFLFEPKL